MTDVLLATCADLPEGEYGGHLLIEEFAARGISARWVVWDDPGVDWATATAVGVRSTWDYELHRTRFLEWAHRVESMTRLVNPARAMDWNTDKLYLLDLLGAGLPVVPTVAAEDEMELPSAIATFDVAVVKPRVGAGGRGVVVFDQEPGGPADLDESALHAGPWIVQPLVASIHAEGETSVFVLGGEVVSQVQKLPAGDEIRVHEEFGGRSVPVAVTDEAASLARRTVEVAESLLDLPLPVARVDLMRLADGTLAVSELEVTEPGLYLEIVPENAKAYVETLVALLTPGT